MGDTSFVLDTTGINLDLFNERFQAALEAKCAVKSKELEGYAKENKIWVNRSSRAWQGLTGTYEMKDKGAVIVLAHTVDYGLWLELAHEKKYAIVEPTIRLQSQAVFDSFQGLLDKLK
jgi:hypothetical protein